MKRILNIATVRVIWLLDEILSGAGVIWGITMRIYSYAVASEEMWRRAGALIIAATAFLVVSYIGKVYYEDKLNEAIEELERES